MEREKETDFECGQNGFKCISSRQRGESKIDTRQLLGVNNMPLLQMFEKQFGLSRLGGLEKSDAAASIETTNKRKGELLQPSPLTLQ